MSAVAKYLQHYAEPESQWLESFSYRFAQCLAIPMYKESPANFDYFCDFASLHPGTLLIIVLNRPVSDHEQLWAQTLINSLSTPLWQAAHHPLSYYPLAQHSGVLLVDRCVTGAAIATEQGVGLARKIANDIACQLIQRQQIQQPWIFNTDADARLPQDYFTSAEAFDSNKHAALLFSYQHIGANQPTLDTATQLYELSLAYYVAGLAWAGSPYAYHTLGSIMVVNYKHYAQVRGFPKRAGAEDFYLLNKLAKTAAIVSLDTSISILSRASNRVPFGTGPAVQQIIASGDYDAMPFYDPAIFHYLRAMLAIISALANGATLQAALHTIDEPGVDKALLESALIHFDLYKALHHTNSHAKTQTQRLRQLTTWFDSFKTLKFLHYIRDMAYPMLAYSEWQQAIKQQAFGQELQLPELAS
ncbi:hypothetical protein NO559_14595 [Dasania sp. GY-MA-18]|uniref:Uncharacterized protein n=1 Tax=Dasania phycosphaerae TaxID=2950436 RepID=A0A9J6RPD8_9GAMM|nr:MULTISPECIES: hypothetical protein [Dasania]MCR8924009.1 hypothetical protein [Dasania sp. GY-MA-18]MCZ0866582.1 hypothetical protein [Dasania phycosphaerae]MCZ0870167.1 hypothetical protein [Dasania phycosphaerae]